VQEQEDLVVAVELHKFQVGLQVVLQVEVVK
jgi:hypothetical protein